MRSAPGSAAFMLLAAFACGESGGDTALCVPGQRACVCTPSMTCEGALQCTSGVCLPPSDTSTTGSGVGSGATSTGDVATTATSGGVGTSTTGETTLSTSGEPGTSTTSAGPTTTAEPTTSSSSSTTMGATTTMSMTTTAGTTTGVVCDDGDPDTQDLHNPTLGCCIQQMMDWDGPEGGSCPGPGCDPAQFGEIALCGTIEWDTDTDLVWSPEASILWNDYNTHCNTLVLGGISWRAPTIDDVRTLISGCPATDTTGSCAIDEPSCLTQSCGNCGSCSGGAASAGPVLVGSSRRYCKRGTAFCSASLASLSLCSGCAPSSHWEIGYLNANLIPAPNTDVISARCVAALP